MRYLRFRAWLEELVTIREGGVERRARQPLPRLQPRVSGQAAQAALDFEESIDTSHGVQRNRGDRKGGSPRQPRHGLMSWGVLASADLIA